MYETTLWERYYLTRKAVLFLKQYTDTLLFKISSPLSSIFWIFSSIVSGTVSTPLQVVAVLTLLIPGVYFYFMFRPFNVELEWEQIHPAGKITERANYRNHIYIDDTERAEVRVTVLFDSSVDSYKLQFDADYPLEVYPGASAPNNSEYDEETNTLLANNVDNVRFFFTLKVEGESADLNIHDPTIRIKDSYDYDHGLFEYLPSKILNLFKRDPILLKISLY